MKSRVPMYERDPRATRIETRVVESGTADGRPWVVMADTVLFPAGGGQPCDLGTVDGVRVLGVHISDGQVRHVLARAVISEDVVVELDWARRFDHMQQHTAQHLITAIAADRFGWETTAFHLGEHVSDVELDVERLTDDQMLKLEEAVAAEVRANRPVVSRRVGQAEYEDLAVRSRGLPAGHTGDVRLVEIRGIDLNTCGGTHCAGTGELEAIKLLNCESARGGTKLSFVAGSRVRRRLAVEVERSAQLRTLLGASDANIVPALQTRLDGLKDQARTIRRLEEELAVTVAERLLASGGETAHGHWDDKDLSFLQQVAREVAERAPERSVFLTAGDEAGFFLLSAGPAATLDVGAVGPEIARLLEGRGGGSGGLFQGRAAALSRRHEALTAVREAGEPKE